MVATAAMEEWSVDGERFLDPGGRIQPKTFHVFYLLSVLGNICIQIFFTISVSDLGISVNRYFKTDIFLCYTLSVYKDYKKQINSRRKTDIVKKKMVRVASPRYNTDGPSETRKKIYVFCFMSNKDTA